MTMAQMSNQALNVLEIRERDIVQDLISLLKLSLTDIAAAAAVESTAQRYSSTAGGIRRIFYIHEGTSPEVWAHKYHGKKYYSYDGSTRYTSSRGVPRLKLEPHPNFIRIDSSQKTSTPPLGHELLQARSSKILTKRTAWDKFMALVKSAKETSINASS